MTEAVLDSEGRIALPEDVRARLHLKPGDTVTVEIYRPGHPPGPPIPPWAHDDPDWEAKANARIAAARAATQATAAMTLEEAREILNNRDLSVSAKEWPEDSVAWVDELRGRDTEKIDRIGSLLNEHHRG